MYGVSPQPEQAGELKQRFCELGVFYVQLGIHQVGFTADVLNHIIPVLLVIVLCGNGSHFESALPFLTRTNIHAVSTAQTIQHIHLNPGGSSSTVFPVFSIVPPLLPALSVLSHRARTDG